MTSLSSYAAYQGVAAGDNRLGDNSSGSNFWQAAIRCLLFAVTLVGAFLSSSASRSMAADQKIDPAKAARSVNGKWYDRETGSYVPPKTAPHRDNAIRMDGRLASIGPERDWSWLEAIGKLIGDFFVLLGYIFTALGYVLLAILISGLIAGIFFITYFFVRSYRGVSQSQSFKELTIDPAKIEDLPFEEMQSSTDPLGDCRELARAGKFDEAIIYLYGYQLLAMDHARKIHLHKGKTNRMYLRELRSFEALGKIVELTVEKFEWVYFGKHSLTKQSFLEAWNLLDTFHKLIAQVETPLNEAVNLGAVSPGGAA